MQVAEGVPPGGLGARSSSAKAVHDEFVRAGIDSASAARYCTMLSEEGYGTLVALNTLSALSTH